MHIIFQIQLAAELLIFVCVVLMNIAKRNTTLVTTYLVQSIVLVILLSVQAFQENSLELFVITMCMLGIKVILAPQIFLRFITTSKVNLSASTYINVPMTLGVIILLT